MSAPSPPSPSLAAAATVYTVARLGLVAVVAGLLVLAGVPLVIAVLVGLVVALPLSMLVLREQRVRLDQAIAVTAARRSAERDALRARLRGEADTGGGSSGDVPDGAEPGGSADQPAEREADPGRG